VESLLRQSLGVSLTARGQASYKPAPPVATGPLPDEDEIGASDSGPFTGGEVPQDAKFADWKDLKAKLQDKGGADGMSEEDLEGLFGVDGAATTHDEL
jgi:heat shock protein beta